jgi:hypothetical protein
MKPRAVYAALLPLALSGAPVLSGCSPTATYGTGEAPEIALFREVTGGLLTKNEKPPIEYQPRAPLVMPPTAEQLPTPVETADAASPDWPVDPGERVLASSGVDQNSRAGGSQAEYRRLKPLIGVMPQHNPDLDTGGSPYDIVHSRRQQQEFQQALAESKGYGRKERRFLTDPPTEYREPAATAPAEFENINSSGGGGGGWLRWLMGGRG